MTNPKNEIYCKLCGKVCKKHDKLPNGFFADIRWTHFFHVYDKSHFDICGECFDEKHLITIAGPMGLTECGICSIEELIEKVEARRNGKWK